MTVLAEKIAHLSPEKRRLLELVLRDQGVELDASLITAHERDPQNDAMPREGVEALAEQEGEARAGDRLDQESLRNPRRSSAGRDLTNTGLRSLIEVSTRCPLRA